jgi:carbon-monoxide dehydrogenase medium subunit
MTAANIGDQQVRNRGTIGGSVAHADPGADYPTVLALLEARFHTADGAPREITAADFFRDLFTTALRPSEILTRVTIPRVEGSAVYLKHRHPASSFAVVGIAALLLMKDDRCEDVRIAIGGACATPVRATLAEHALMREIPTNAAIESASALVAEALLEPFGDGYASGEFRVHLAQVMTRRALTQLVAKAR